MDYKVRLAAATDLPRIEEIYAYAREFMAKTGNPNQWGKTNPPSQQLEADIRMGKLYVVTDDSAIHGVFFYSVEEDPTYAKIYQGSWSADKQYGVIHRVAGDGSGGVFRTCVDYCSLYSDYLRIDTHHDNQVMQHAVEKAGFRRCGIIYIADGTPRIAYDRV